MKGRVTLALILLGIIWVLPARAIMIKYSLERLSTGSEKIVVGDVVGMESRYLEPGQGIHTFVTIRVEEIVKGDVGDEIVLRVPGGTVGDATMVVEHAPYFDVGEKVLVFVTRQVDGQDIVYNADNGKYTVEDGIVLEKEVPLDNFLLVIRAYLDGSEQ
jgi:signal peptidase I